MINLLREAGRPMTLEGEHACTFFVIEDPADPFSFQCEAVPQLCIADIVVWNDLRWSVVAVQHVSGIIPHQKFKIEARF